MTHQPATSCHPTCSQSPPVPSASNGNCSSSSSSSHRGTGWQNRSGTSLQLVWVNPAMKGKSKERGRNTKSYTSTYLSFLFGAWEQIKTETYKSFKKKKTPPAMLIFTICTIFFNCLFISLGNDSRSFCFIHRP